MRRDLSIALLSIAPSLYNAGEDERTLHGVAGAFLAPAAILVRLHLAGVVALWIVGIDANGRGDGIEGRRLQQIDTGEEIDRSAALWGGPLGRDNRLRHCLPFDDKSFPAVRQSFYSGNVGKAEAGNAGEQPAEE